MAKNDTAERIVTALDNLVTPVVLGKESEFGLWTPDTAGEKGLKILLYGASGSGKTYMAGTFPDPIFLDLEDGMRTLLPMGRRILRYPKDPKQTVTDLGQVRQFYKLVRDVDPTTAPFKTIVIDSINELQVLVLKNLLGKYQATRQYDDQPTMADYGKLARDMQNTVRWFIQLPYHVVFTAVAVEAKYEDDKISPAFIGQKTGPDIQRMMDIVGYCHTVQKKKDDPVQHVVGFEDTPRYVAKDRTGRLGTVIANSYQAIQQQISGSRNGKENNS